MQLGEEMLTPPQLAGIVMSTVGRFCHSADPAIASAHVPPVNGVTGLRRAQLMQMIVPLAASAWTDLQRMEGRLPFSHDHYLKMWQLTQPSLNADFVLFDEAQDADPVIAAVIQGQGCAQKIAVGDSCQAIYGWRGAVDALATWPADQRLYLSQSFRFGVPIADEANKWLENLGAVLRLKGTPSIPSAIGTIAAPDAVLCRTNAEAVSQALTLLEQGRRVALVGGGDDIKRLAEAARELQQRGHTSHPELAAFRTWNAVQRYVRDDEGGADLATFVRLVDAHGPEAVIRTIDQLSSEDNASVVISTAHKAKGREWNQVLIAPDFHEPAEDKGTGERGVIPRADAMLAYVAVTRAKQRLDRGGLAWIDNYASGAPAQGPATAEPAGHEQATVIPAASAVETQPPAPAAGQPVQTQLPTEPAAEASAQAAAPLAGPAAENAIRIEHDAEGTRVYGTDESQSGVHKALHDQGFKFSRNKGFWYLNSTWKYPTRSDRVRRLQARLDALAVSYSTDAPQSGPAQVPASQGSSAKETASADSPASGRTATAEPPIAPNPVGTESTSAGHQESPAAPSEATSANTPGATDEDSSDITAPSEYEQQSLFGTTATRQPPAKASQPATHKPKPAADASVAKTPVQGTEQLEDLGHDVTLKSPQPAAQDADKPEKAEAGTAAETEPPVTADLSQPGVRPDSRPAQPAPAPATTGDETPPAATTASAAISESLASIPVDLQPYEGSRAQATSGSLIIEDDHRAWAGARARAGDSALPEEHPRVRQFTIAWQRVTAKGLDDGPGPAAARYHALAHAALALSSAIDRTSNPHEPEALDLIATHARKHSVRLRATADRMFSTSRQAGYYQGGRAQAEKGSRMIEKDYRAWIRTGSPLEAARDPALWQRARRTEKAWHEVRRHGVTDGPAAAATRYRELADAAQALADGYTVALPILRAAATTRTSRARPEALNAPARHRASNQRRKRRGVRIPGSKRDRVRQRRLWCAARRPNGRYKAGLRQPAPATTTTCAPGKRPRGEPQRLYASAGHAAGPFERLASVGLGFLCQLGRACLRVEMQDCLDLASDGGALRCERSYTVTGRTAGFHGDTTARNGSGSIRRPTIR